MQLIDRNTGRSYGVAEREITIGIINRETSQIVIIPWTPQKIKFRSGNMKWAEYEIMDVGTITKPIGRELRQIAWSDGVLPGEGVKDYPWQKWSAEGWKPPSYYQGLFSEWYQHRTPLTILITNTPVMMNVVIKYYDITYKEANGSFHYDINFREDRDLIYNPVPIYRENNKTEDEPIYIVREDDTLWGIAECYMGSGMGYSALYEANKDVIEAAAQEHGFDSSDNGERIFAGTVLKIPQYTDTSAAVAGKSIYLSGTPIYVSSDSTRIAAHLTGEYYLYDGKNINGRYRICDSLSDVGKTPIGSYVTGWIDAGFAERPQTGSNIFTNAA